MTQTPSGEPDRPQDEPGPQPAAHRGQVSVRALVVFLILIVVLSVVLWLLSDRREAFTIDFVALLGAISQASDKLAEQMKPLIKALTWVTVIILIASAPILGYKFFAPTRVQPSVYWSAPLKIGESGEFDFPIDGHKKAKISFTLNDAQPNQTPCTPETRLDVSIGPKNNQQRLAEIGPGSNQQITLSLAGYSGDAHISVIAVNARQSQCAVDVLVSNVTLTNLF